MAHERRMWCVAGTLGVRTGSVRRWPVEARRAGKDPVDWGDHLFIEISQELQLQSTCHVNAVLPE